MGVSRYTVKILQSWGDTDSTNKDGILITSSKEGEQWAGQVSLVKGGHHHCWLLTTTPVFESETAAVNELQSLSEDVRKVDLRAPVEQ